MIHELLRSLNRKQTSLELVRAGSASDLQCQLPRLHTDFTFSFPTPIQVADVTSFLGPTDIQSLEHFLILRFHPRTISPREIVL